MRKWDIEAEANKFRRTSGIDSVGISNIFDVCSSEFYLIRYPIGENAVLGAALIKDNDKIIFSNSSISLCREIFTVAHEIGHFVLGHISEQNQMHHDLTINDSTGEESDANYFAVCLLMPRDKVNEFINSQFQYQEGYDWTSLEIAAIMGVFNVSFDAAVNRLNNLGYLTNGQRDLLIKQKNETKVSNLLRAIGISPDLCFAQKTKRIPVDFIKWVKYNYSNGFVPKETMEKAISFLDNVTLDDFEVVPKNEKDDFDLDAYFREDPE